MNLAAIARALHWKELENFAKVELKEFKVGDAEIEEWGSTQPVTPLAKLRVSPRDFPYLDKVQFSL